MYTRSIFHSIVAFHSFCLLADRMPYTAQSYVFAPLGSCIANMYGIMSIVSYVEFLNQYHVVIWQGK